MSVASTIDPRLARAKAYIAIAESKDAKREAYKRAAKELVAYRDESPRQWRSQAASYCNTSTATIDKLVQWYDSGLKAETPFLMDKKATQRAAISHARKVLRESSAKELEDVVADLPRAAKNKIVEAMTSDYQKRVEPTRAKNRSDRNKRVDVRWVEAEGLFDSLFNKGRTLLRLAQSVEWDDESRDMLVENGDRLRALVELIVLAFDGDADVDWDGELAKITEQAA